MILNRLRKIKFHVESLKNSLNVKKENMKETSCDRNVSIVYRLIHRTKHAFYTWCGFYALCISTEHVLKFRKNEKLSLELLQEPIPTSLKISTSVSLF